MSWEQPIEPQYLDGALTKAFPKIASLNWEVVFPKIFQKWFWKSSYDLAQTTP